MDQASAWSDVSSFETGLLSSAEWGSARWIGRPPAGSLSLQGANWIWYPEGAPASSAPVAVRYFTRTVDLPGTAAVSKAQIVLSGDDTADLWVNGQQLSTSPRTPNSWRQAALVDVTHVLHAGRNTLVVTARNAAAGPAGVIARLHVERADRTSTDVVTDASWRAAHSAPSGWDGPASTTLRGRRWR